MILFFHQHNVALCHSARHCLIVMLEKFIESMYIRENFVALFTDLSKTFNCVHNLLTTTLSWYVVTTKSINLMFSYSRDGAVKVRMNNSYSTKPGMMFHKVQWLDLYYLTSTSLTCYLNVKMIILIDIWMARLLILVQKICL